MITKEFYPKVNAVVLKDHAQLFAEYYVKSISLFQKEALGIPSLPRGTKICIFIKIIDKKLCER